MNDKTNTETNQDGTQAADSDSVQTLVMQKRHSDMIKELLAVMPFVTCNELHHRKQDYHALYEPCPALARYEKARRDSEDFLS